MSGIGSFTIGVSGISGNLLLVMAAIPPGPATRGFAITPSDTSALPAITRQIWVGGAGNIALVLNGDTTSLVMTAVPAGTMLDISAKQINATQTTATNLVGFY